MKKKQKIRLGKCLFCGIALLCASCTEDAGLLQDNPSALQLLSVTLDGTAGTAATRTLRTSVDAVGVYVTKPDHTAYASATAYLYRLSGTTWSTDTPPEITPSAGEAKVYAYYPSGLAVTNNSGGAHTVPVSVLSADDFLATNQTDYLLTGTYDKAAASGSKLKVSSLDASSTNRALNITLVHALSKVSLRVLKSETATEKLTLKKVEILSPTNRIQTGSSGVMDLSTGVLSGLSSTSQLTLSNAAGIVLNTNSSAPNVTCLVAPMAGEEYLLSFRLTVDVLPAGAATPTELVFETGVVSTPQQWQTSKHYVYKVTVDKMGGGFSGVKIDDWQNDASQNTSIGI